MKFPLILAAALVCQAMLLAQENPPPTPASRVVATATSGIFRVASDGKITPLDLPKGTVTGGGGPQGTTDPQVSPDGKLIAFIHRGSLKIRPVQGGEAISVVSGYLHELLLITGWSADSGNLVYFLGPPQADDAPPSKVTEEKQFVYDLKDRAKREISINGTVVGWLPGGEMLVQNLEEGTISSQSLIAHAKPKVLLKDTAGYGQIILSPDGKELAVSSSKPNDTSSSQLLRVELATGKTTPITKPGAWAEFQWPKWSLSGKQLAWFAQVSFKEGIPKSVLVVEGKTVSKPAQVFEFFWLTESIIILQEQQAIVVLDITTGKELGRKATK